MSTSSFRPPPHSDVIKVSFPQEHVMLLTFNRPKALNSVNDVMSADIDAVLTWFESEPDLWLVPIIDPPSSTSKDQLASSLVTGVK